MPTTPHQRDIQTAPIPLDNAAPGPVLIFGGTFDPPTRAHAELPLQVLREVNATRLVYVPAGRSPHKKQNPHASDHDRLTMLGLALQSVDPDPRIAISTIELDTRPTRSSSPHARPATYTIDTLRAFRHALRPGSSMRLLMGADQAIAFHRWRDPRVIMAIAEPLVMLRQPAESPERFLAALRDHWPPAELQDWAHRLIKVEVRDASSTDVRERLADPHASDADLTELLAPDVLAYIRRERLYREQIHTA